MATVEGEAWASAPREVHLSENDLVQDYERLRLNWLDPVAKRPIPNTRVYVDGRLLLEVNSLACFGPEPAAGPLIGIFGDSVVQGVGDSFVNHVCLAGHCTINGGVEGAQLHQIIDRCLEVNAARPLGASVVHPGFHNLLYNETSFMHWEAQLGRLRGLRNVALCRLTADINAEVAARGYDGIHGDGYGVVHHSKDRATSAAFYEALDRKNRLISKACDMWGFLLIDLDHVLAPRAYDEVGRKFFDAIHPQPSMYAAIGAAVAEQLRPMFPGAAALTAPAGAPSLIPDRGRVYPLW